MIRSIAASAILAASLSACQTPRQEPPHRVPHLDPNVVPPGLPELFAPGFVSTAHGERDAAFLPDQHAFYYTLWAGRFGVILETHTVGEGWSQPEVASFSGRYSDLEPFVTADGQRLFFASNRPVEPGGEPKDYDIWLVERLDTSWGAPVHLGPNVNTEANEFYPSVDERGTLYFTAAYEQSAGGEDIWATKPLDDGTFGPAVSVGPGVNTESDEFNALIAPDGAFLVFSSFGREDGFGGGDLYISFRDSTGQLGPGINLGPSINSESLDFSPALTPDGRTFLFSSRRSAIPPTTMARRTYSGLKEALSSPKNGDLDIYRVDASFIKALKDTR